MLPRAKIVVKMQSLARLGKDLVRAGCGTLAGARELTRSAAAATATPTTTAARSVHFDVDENSQVDHVFKKLNRKLNMEGVLLEARIRTWHTKKSDQKIIDQRRTAKRLARRAIGRKINWIMKKRERGF